MARIVPGHLSLFDVPAPVLNETVVMDPEPTTGLNETADFLNMDVATNAFSYEHEIGLIPYVQTGKEIITPGCGRNEAIRSEAWFFYGFVRPGGQRDLALCFERIYQSGMVESVCPALSVRTIGDALSRHRFFARVEETLGLLTGASYAADAFMAPADQATGDNALRLSQ